MTKWADQPIYWLMKWLEDGLRAEELIPPVEKYMLDSSDTDGLNFQVPLFTPSQQSPEVVTLFNNEEFSDAPFFVYTITNTFMPNLPYIKTGELGCVLYADDVDLLLEIIAYIMDLAGRSHWSAADLNRHFANDDVCPFDFKSVLIDSAAGPTETTDEGGRYAYVITIRYDCVYDPRPAETFSNADFAYPFSDVGMKP